jgi:hypothetical protein
MPIRHGNGKKADPSLFAQDDSGAIFRIATQSVKKGEDD